MQTRRLGNSDLHITPIGFGAWAIGGGGWAFALGRAGRRRFHRGHSRSHRPRHQLDRHGRGLWPGPLGRGRRQGAGGRVEAAVCVHQVRPRLGFETGQIGKSLKAASIRAECEASLKRLKVDVIDLYQIHWPEPDEDIEEGWQTVLKLKAEGKIRWTGVSNFSAEQMARIAEVRADHVASAALFADPPRGREPRFFPIARRTTSA